MFNPLSLFKEPLFSLKVSGFPGELRVVRFALHEELSRPYEATLTVASENPNLTFAKLMDKPALLKISGQRGKRHLHGTLFRFEYIEQQPRYTTYELTLGPLLSRLSFRQDSRIFQNKDTLTIVKEVLEEAGIPSSWVEDKTSATYNPRKYCVQYRESDLAFVSRLLEEDGIFYYFKHEAKKHILVLGDDEGAYSPMTGGPILYRRPGGNTASDEHLRHFRISEEIRPGKATFRDYDFVQPTKKMEVEKEAEVHPDLEVYDYPGGYYDPASGSPDKGATIAQIRLEELQVELSVGEGEGDCPHILPGHILTVAEHPRQDFNADYLIVSATHRGEQPQALDELASGDFHFSNSLTCIPKDRAFRPPRVTPRPVVHGVQTARVVGPAGEEIYTDEHGRVKVQFHWDRDGNYDEKSSCWIRVSQPWAGAGFGGSAIPRIDQEVIIEFVEGDPDRPILTGRLYNALNKPPGGLPGTKASTTIRSNSTPGGGGFNEISLADGKGEECFSMHAQKDMTIDVTDGDMTTTVKTGNQTNTVKTGHQTTTVETGNQTNTVKTGNQTINVETGTQSTTVSKGISVASKTEHIHLTAATDIKLSVGGNYIEIKSDGTITIKGKTVHINPPTPAG